RCELDVITAKAVCFALPGHARQPAGGRHYLSAPETAGRRTTRRCAASARDRYWLPRAVDRRLRRSAELLTFPDSNALLPAQGYWLARSAAGGKEADFVVLDCNGTAELLKIIADEQDDRIPAAARFSLNVLARQYAAIREETVAIERRIHAWHRSSEESRRLEEIPGVGPIVATALVAEVGDWKEFTSGRSLAAWIGLVPRQHSTGGKERLGRISKQGNRHLRWLLVAGAMAVIRYARQHGTKR